MANFLLRVPNVTFAASFVQTAPYGASVEDVKPGPNDLPEDYPPPDEVYLIYLTQNTRNLSWIARHMKAPADADPNVTAANLFNLAKANATTPFRVGQAFVNLIWTKPCYLYLVLDSDAANFIDSDNPEFDPILFFQTKPVLGAAGSNSYDPNYSFYNGILLTVAGRSAFRCINYLKDENGYDLHYPQVRSYGFEIRFEAKVDGGPSRPCYIEPDGQNQGPPASDMPMVTLELREDRERFSEAA
jgi:hypothetical protein